MNQALTVGEESGLCWYVVFVWGIVLIWWHVDLVVLCVETTVFRSAGVFQRRRGLCGITVNKQWCWVMEYISVPVCLHSKK